MASFRSIDSDIWQHPAFRKAAMHVREVFLYLFSCAADDEGRFRADPEDILEAAFSRRHPVTEADIEGALEYLAETRLILRYGEHGEYGFLLGWYEHQYIKKDRRSPSTLPEPPIAFASWQAADDVRERYAKAVGCPAARARYHDAIAWAANENGRVIGLVPACHQPATRPVPQCYPEVEVEVEVEREGTPYGLNGFPRPADPEPIGPSPEPSPKPVVSHTRAKTDRDLTYEACLGVFDIAPSDLDGKQWATYAKAMNKLVAQTGLEPLQYWAETEAQTGLRDLGNGARPESKVPQVVRREITAQSWADEFAKRRAPPSGHFILRHDGVKLYERDWDENARCFVAQYRKARMWDDERGMATNDKRHPSQQAGAQPTGS